MLKRTALGIISTVVLACGGDVEVDDPIPGTGGSGSTSSGTTTSTSATTGTGGGAGSSTSSNSGSTGGGTPTCTSCDEYFTGVDDGPFCETSLSLYQAYSDCVCTACEVECANDIACGGAADIADCKSCLGTDGSDLCQEELQSCIQHDE